MTSVRSTTTGFSLAAALAAVLAAASPAAAGTIGPNQYFSGDVNGYTTSPAPIRMACFGAVHPGETGHPLSGQYAQVDPAPASSAADLGYTGSTGTAVSVTLIITSGTIVQIVPLGTVSDYGTKVSIPVTLTLPCYGGAQASFSPVPGSATAKPATLTVDFIGQP